MADAFDFNPQTEAAKLHTVRSEATAALREAGALPGVDVGRFVGIIAPDVLEKDVYENATLRAAVVKNAVASFAEQCPTEFFTVKLADCKNGTEFAKRYKDAIRNRDGARVSTWKPERQGMTGDQLMTSYKKGLV